MIIDSGDVISLFSLPDFNINQRTDLKNKLLEIENGNDLSGLLIFASEGINGTICAEKNLIDIHCHHYLSSL